MSINILGCACLSLRSIAKHSFLWNNLHHWSTLYIGTSVISLIMYCSFIHSKLFSICAYRSWPTVHTILRTHTDRGPKIPGTMGYLTVIQVRNLESSSSLSSSSMVWMLPECLWLRPLIAAHNDGPSLLQVEWRFFTPYHP